MIDLSLLREHPEQTVALLKKKDPDFDAQWLLNLDRKVVLLRSTIESLRHKKNQLASVPKERITDEVRTESAALSDVIKTEERNLSVYEEEFTKLYLCCPNVPASDVPEGGKEANVVMREWGQKVSLPANAKNHLVLMADAGWIDLVQAAAMSGSQFVLYHGRGVSLLYALAFFMLKNNIRHGYNAVVPPYLVSRESLTVASNFPKFTDQVYAISDEDLFLIPTAEVPLTNIYRNKILSAAELPVRMTSWTSCFRKEAGGYGATERGLIRIHQFEKVELYTLCEPECSSQEQDRMIACAESILQQLGLHYRITLLASRDCSFPSAKTYDIEVWLPVQGHYYEVSSISNCTDFQARRGKIRYRKGMQDRAQLVHTLNGSSLALPRLMVAIAEVYQQEGGGIALPEVLAPYLLT